MTALVKRERLDIQLTEVEENLRFSKRARTGSVSQRVPVPDATKTLVTHFRNLESYEPGHILRVELENFQVCQKGAYDFVPGLNMIVGPNGSGKSTVVTAIYLVLGGSQSDTARDSLADFITQGEDHSSVVVYMRSETGFISASLHISRRAKEQYEIDGKSCSHKDIEALAHRYSIYVNNRCQFLPQERVATFSQETHQQRLASTLESVGESKMMDKIHELESLGKEIRENSEDTGKYDNEIESLETEKAELAAKVERLKRLNENKKELEALQGVSTLVKYRTAKEKFDAVKRELDSLEERKREMENVNSGLKNARDKFTALKSEKQREKSELDALINSKNRELSACERAMNEEVARSSMRNFRSLEGDYKAWQEEIRKAEKALERSSAALEDVRAKLDQEALFEAEKNMRAANVELEAIKAEHRSADEQRKRAGDQLKRITNEKVRLDGQVSNIQASRKALLYQTHLREELERACRVVQEHKDEFTQAVILPPLLTLRIKPGFDKYVASVLSITNLNVFICQNSRDWEKLGHLFKREHIKSRIGNVGPPSGRRIDRSILERYGFDGFISDLFEDSEMVLRYLNNAYHLSDIPYSRDVVSASQEDAMRRDQVSLRLFIDRSNRVSMIRSKYGSRQTIINRAPLAKNYDWVFHFKDSPLSALQETKDKISRFENDIIRLKEEVNTLSSTIESISAREAAKAEEITPYRKICRQQNSYKQMIESGVKEVETEKKIFDDLKRREESFEDTKKKTLQALAKIGAVITSDQFPKLLDDVLKLEIRRGGTKIAIEFAESNIKRINLELQGQSKVIDEKIKAATEAVEQRKLKISQLKTEVSKLKLSMGEAVYKDAQEKAQTMTVEEAMRAIGNLEASLALNEEGESYEQTQKLFEQLVERLQRLKERRDRAAAGLRTMQGKLDSIAPAIQSKCKEITMRISNKFSEFFERLHCRGEVKLICPELKFEEWGIEIQVSYRNGEPLRALSSRTQSGGEKAVATAVYLMALQGSARYPFFVLDEINQGMDKINEHAIHRFIVETACIHSKAQYFMVTPKLLPDLVYHSQKMKILCVFSASHVQHSSQSIDEIIETCWI